MEIRELNENDLNEMLALERATQSVPWTEEVFRECFRAGYSGFGIELNQVLIGFILISERAGECHILNLCIDPDHHRQGHGKKLLQFCLDLAKNKQNTFAYLEVRKSNIPAIKLYENMGFVQISERKNYYPRLKGREDALIFAKDLRIELE